MAEKMSKKLVLEDGSVFEGYGFGANRSTIAELIFNTSMVGYQEIVSDSTNLEQMVVLTYPIIGSYGVNDEDDESKSPNIGALIVRDYNDVPSNFRYTRTLSEAMEEDGIPGIYGLDTRALTRLIRSKGHIRGMLTNIETPTEDALSAIRNWVPSDNPVSIVSCKKRWYSRTPNHKYNVVAVDCGVRLSTIKALNKLGCNVTVVPYNTAPEQILSLQADGIYISNGPGDPNKLPCVISLIQSLMGKLPILGTDLGHELICIACGGKVEKMSVGHHGSNHPIRCLDTGKIEMANQNHDYCLNPDSVSGTDLRITHVNVLDGTVEAAECKSTPTFSTQFSLTWDHPMYQKFIALMERRKNNA